MFNWLHRHASGRLIPCEIRLVRMPADDDHCRIRGSITDNTERRRREAVQDYQSDEVHRAEHQQILMFVAEQTALAIDQKRAEQAEAELLRALARERELSALKSSFVSMISHEFRTPLSIIMSSAEILDSYFDRLDPAERREQLLSIQKNSLRMAR